MAIAVDERHATHPGRRNDANDAFNPKVQRIARESEIIAACRTMAGAFQFFLKLEDAVGSITDLFRLRHSYTPFAKTIAQ